MSITNCSAPRHRCSRLKNETTNLGRLLGTDCKDDHCDGFNYEHRDGGFSLEFTDPADTFTESAIVAALTTLVKQLSRFEPRFWVSITAATYVLSELTGEEFTLISVDQDAFFGEEIKKCVGAGYDLGPNEVTQYSVATGHIGGKFDSRCGD